MQDEMIKNKKYKVTQGVKFPKKCKIGVYLRMEMRENYRYIFLLNTGNECEMEPMHSTFERVKKKINRESGFQTMFRDFIADEMSKNPLFLVGPYVWELKVADTDRFEFSKVKGHQIQGLLDVKNGSGLFHKISDMPIFSKQTTRFCIKKPFDCLFIQHAKAYVVIWFYKPRQKKVMYWIEVDKFISMKAIFGDRIWDDDNPPKKSCTEEELAHWAQYVFEFKDLAAQKGRAKNNG